MKKLLLLAGVLAGMTGCASVLGIEEGELAPDATAEDGSTSETASPTDTGSPDTSSTDTAGEDSSGLPICNFDDESTTFDNCVFAP